MSGLKNKWMEEIWGKYSSAISWCYLIHGNTKDQVLFETTSEELNRVDFTKYLSLELSSLFHYILYYNRATGLQFLGPEEVSIETHGLANRVHVHDILNAINKNEPLRTSGGMPVVKFETQEYKDPMRAFELFNKCMNSPYQGAIIVDSAENLLSSDGWGKNPAVDIMATHIRNWSTDFKINSTGNIFLMVCRDNIGTMHPALKDLEAKVEQIYVKYPDVKVREKFVDLWRHQTELPDDLVDQFDSKIIARSTAGLNLTMLEDCLCRCLQQKKFDAVFIKERKDEVIRATYGDVIEIKEPSFGFEVVGGYENLIDYFKNNVIQPMMEGNTKRCPMGVLFSGPPGTGKSLFAEAAAKEVGMLFVVLRFSKIFSKWVGDSERNLDRILKAVESLAPAIVFIDEIDQSGHRRGGAGEGDSGVSQRVFQRLLEFMSETKHRGQILFLAATNRPDLLDPAMKRAGRFDRKIPFLAPNRSQRKNIIISLFKKHKLKLAGKEFPDELLDITDHYVGADLESIVLAAYELADNRKSGTSIIRTDELLTAAKFLKPSVAPSQIKEMTKLALDECNDLRLIPASEIKKVKEIANPLIRVQPKVSKEKGN